MMWEHLLPLQKFLSRRQLQVVTVAVKYLAPAPQQGQGGHLSRDETPNNFTLPGPQDYDPQQQLHLLRTPLDHRC